MAINVWRAQTLNLELYSCDLEVQEYIDCRSGLPPRSYVVDLQNMRCKCGKFQSIRYMCVHVHLACATTNWNVKQFIDKVYTLQRTLHIWGNEFPVIPDVSNWEVPPPAFEMLPDHCLRRCPKGLQHMMRIRGDMDVKQMGKPKHYGVYWTSDHNRSTCPHHIYYAG